MSDKVTIEAKSPSAGTISEFHVEVGQNVEVGQPFFSLDLNGTAAAAAPDGQASAAPAAPAPPIAAVATAAASAPQSASTAASRIHPSGKPSLISFPPRSAAAIAKAAAAPAAPAATKSAAKATVGAVSHDALPPRFRRPLISEEEMECINAGGAGFVF